MQKFAIILALPVIFSACGKQQNANIEASDLKTATDTMSYALAYDVATRLKGMDIQELNLDAVSTAFNQVFGDADSVPLIDKNSIDKVLEEYFMKKQMEKAEGLKKQGETFLNENKSKEGVNVLPSGLQYKVLKPAAGAEEKLGNRQKVLVNYTGRLVDGKIFDSTEGGEPAEINVNEVIPGWTEALKLMPIGSTWEIYLPADLAYGSSRGPGNALPPYSVLIFKIELIKALD